MRIVWYLVAGLIGLGLSSISAAQDGSPGITFEQDPAAAPAPPGFEYASLMASRHEGKENSWRILWEGLDLAIEAMDAWQAEYPDLIPGIEASDLREGPYPRGGLAPALKLMEMLEASGAREKFRKARETGPAWEPRDLAPRDWETMEPDPIPLVLRRVGRLLGADLRVRAAAGDMAGVERAFDDLLTLAHAGCDRLLVAHYLAGEALFALALVETRYLLDEGLLDAVTCDALLGLLDTRLPLADWDLVAQAEAIGVSEWLRLRIAEKYDDPDKLDEVIAEVRKSIASQRVRLAKALTSDRDAVGVTMMTVTQLRNSEKGRRLPQLLLRGTRIMLHLEIHRAEQGEYPKALDELGLPREQCIDPFSGEPLAYRRHPEDGKGYLLYGFGADGIDDGGKYHAGQPYLATNAQVTGYDLVINLPRPPLEER